MNIEPIYELQSRLRNTAIAGVNLINEDFRLKRCIETVKTLENTAPVFGKICQQMDKLLAEDCPNPSLALLDAISLVDAVVCTLAVVEIQKEITIMPELSIDSKTAKNNVSIVSDIPYSKLTKLTEAITTSGSGHFTYVCETYENNPEMFYDYRTMAAMVKALGASYTELAERAERWLNDANESILPILMNGFDPKGKKEMVRRVRVIEAIAGANANNFYIQMLNDAEKEVRQELIHALRFDKNNIELVRELLKSSKGKSKQICIWVLAYLEDDEIYESIQKLAESKPDEAITLIQFSKSAQASKIVSDILSNTINWFIASENNLSDTVKNPVKTDKQKTEDTEKLIKSGLLNRTLTASIGKNSPEIYQCYRTILENCRMFARMDKRNTAYFFKKFRPSCNTITYFNYNDEQTRKCMEGSLADTLYQSYILYPNDELKDLIMEFSQKDKTGNFLTSALVIQLLSNDVDEKWLDYNLPKILKNQKYTLLYEILPLFVWDSALKSYSITMSYYDNLLEAAYIYKRPIEFKARSKMTEFLTAQEDRDIDNILSKWCGLYCDEEYCKQLGEHFYKEALTTANPNCINYLKKCGWTNFKGIVAKSLINCNYMSTWTVYDYINYLPFDYAQKLEELNEISELVRSGKVIATSLDINELESIKNL